MVQSFVYRLKLYFLTSLISFNFECAIIISLDYCFSFQKKAEARNFSLSKNSHNKEATESHICNKPRKVHQVPGKRKTSRVPLVRFRAVSEFFGPRSLNPVPSTQFLRKTPRTSLETEQASPHEATGRPVL
ncbi:hypothetical protein BDA96_07G061900 [Sorghum bicolor]|uniref:Uncharacterized protein n=2 Tax=Sorghum bicolor TaxID=4558 RepID=A0A921U8H8_SORBI|nr:hypothetical protein BDA96_07G061900 [Sorghum bicolor]OQU79975.1 hypothetical protein SORBI_3007G059150 [Sorghum bicolor]